MRRIIAQTKIIDLADESRVSAGESRRIEIHGVEPDVLRAHAAEVHPHSDWAGYTVDDVATLPGNRLSQAWPDGSLAGVAIVARDRVKRVVLDLDGDGAVLVDAFDVHGESCRTTLQVDGCGDEV